MQQLSVEEAVRMLHKSADYYAQARPVQEELLRAFQKLFECQTRLAGRFAATSSPLPDLDAASFIQGVSWLATYDLRECGPLFSESAQTMLPVLAKAFPYGDSVEELVGTLDTGSDFLGEAVAGVLSNDLDHLTAHARRFATDPGLLAFVLRSIAAPVISALGRKGAQLLNDLSWTQGYCPVCGAPPSIGYLAKREATDLDALVGGGGQKYLHCSLCAHVWRFRRDACPSCGSHEAKREVLFVEGARHERVELCHACEGYLPTIDFREVDLEPNLLLAPVALMHLDVVAQQKGGKPIYEAPWNR